VAASLAKTLADRYFSPRRESEKPPVSKVMKTKKALNLSNHFSIPPIHQPQPEYTIPDMSRTSGAQIHRHGSLLFPRLVVQLLLEDGHSFSCSTQFFAANGSCMINLGVCFWRPCAALRSQLSSQFSGWEVFWFHHCSLFSVSYKSTFTHASTSSGLSAS
jgi:hypothetical protein